MADPVAQTSRTSARRHPSTARTSRGIKSERLRDGGVKTAGQDAPDIDQLRRSRVEYYSRPPSERSRTTPNSLVPEPRKSSTRSSKSKNTSDLGITKKARSSKSSVRRSNTLRVKGGKDSSKYVYKNSPDVGVRRSHTQNQENEGEALNNIDSEEVLRPVVPPVAPDPPLYSTTEISPTANLAETHPTVHTSRTNKTRPPSASRQPSIVSKSSVRSRSKRRASESPMPIVQEVTPTLPAKTKGKDKEKEKRRASVIGSLFSPLLKSKPSPPTYVECLTCASTKPSTRAATLECGHVMCQSCLKRLFTMSVTDPQHMPPRCCTSEHIPLKHVSKLFDNTFKSRWNLKYLEYTTHNRLYCPARGCGTWIAPQNTRKSTLDPKRTLGTCPKCGTRACGACGRKWHTNTDCDAGTKDESARQFARIAAASGWQRCFNCTATVELKEGCNHMTCRCGAEFCMVCGTKWKSCDCPWFNYSTVADADRLVNDAARIVQAAAIEPLGYADELARRREQEHRDEELARRMQGLELHHWDDADRTGNSTPGMERDWAGNDTFGFGNMAGHFLNDNFVQRATDILTRRISPETREAANRLAAEIRADRAPPIPGNAFLGPTAGTVRPLPGQESGVSESVAENHAGSSSPRRLSHRRYATAEEILDEAGIPTVGRVRSRAQTSFLAEDGRSRINSNTGRRRGSVLAGLATRPGEGRVEQWMNHVEDEELEATEKDA